MGLLQLPIPTNSSNDFSVVQYADDTHYKGGRHKAAILPQITAQQFFYEYWTQGEFQQVNDGAHQCF
jgi:hypothetical protein